MNEYGEKQTSSLLMGLRVYWETQPPVARKCKTRQTVTRVLGISTERGELAGGVSTLAPRTHHQLCSKAEAPALKELTRQPRWGPSLACFRIPKALRMQSLQPLPGPQH